MAKNNLKFDPERANEGNPNNDEFWIALGYSKRPDNWKEHYRKMNRATSSRTRFWRQNQDLIDGGITEPFWVEDY
jgi:hypothetical protein